MSQELGQGGTIPTGIGKSIEIPQSEAPQNQLQLDEKIKMIADPTSGGQAASFKVLASNSDSVPGYLSDKINVDQFNITTQEITLIGFGALTTDNLPEGATNLYLSQATFDNLFATKTTDELTEGVTNKYYSTDLFDADLLLKSTSDLAEGTNLYYTDDRVISALEPHTSDDTIHFADLSGFTSDDLPEGSVNLYLNQATFDSLFSAKTTDDLSEGALNLYYKTELFNVDFSTKSTSDLPEGTNFYFTDLRAANALVPHTDDSSIHFSDLSSFNTDNLSEGANNKYLSAAKDQEIANNTSARHSHANQPLLDSYTQSNAGLANAVTLAHEHSNKSILDATEESFTAALKAKYDGYESGSITSVMSPLELNAGVLTHLNDDGYKHIPSNASAMQYHLLASGTNAGDYNWQPVEVIIANSGVLEQVPSTATDKGVQSAWINSHNTNALTNIKHLDDSELSYLQSDVPSHINNANLHIPAFTSADNNKFLVIDGSTNLVWSSSSSNIVIDGEDYLTAVGSTITASKIDLSQTNIAEGSNISFVGNQISAEQRAISSDSIDSDVVTAISAGWAYTHEQLQGAQGHIPEGGTEEQYIAGDGSVKDFTTLPGQVYKIILGSGANGTVAERLLSSNNEFPTGFSGEVGEVATDLIITHGVGKQIIDVTVFATDGNNITKLIGTGAYATIIGNGPDSEDTENTKINIVSLTTITRTIHVYMQFE